MDRGHGPADGGARRARPRSRRDHAPEEAVSRASNAEKVPALASICADEPSRDVNAASWVQAGSNPSLHAPLNRSAFTRTKRVDASMPSGVNRSGMRPSVRTETHR